jgi:large subunit ribosomal protein L21
MYAVVEVGAKQYTVNKGDTITVEKQVADTDAQVILDKVLMIADDEAIEIGTPYVKGASVTATLVRQTKGRKAISHKYRRRKSSHWTKGHRQQLSVLEIKAIKSA